MAGWHGRRPAGLHGPPCGTTARGRAVSAGARVVVERVGVHLVERDALTVQHDEVDQLRLTLVSEQARYIQARDSKSATLSTLRQHEAALQNQLASAQAAENAQNGFGGVPSLPAGAGYSGGGFAPHGGDYGFFPAPGTNYSVGNEPAIAARLDAMGKALGLHLIGISGYRSPQHSVEVGGFAAITLRVPWSASTSVLAGTCRRWVSGTT